jgi:hypothetical protein
VDGCGLVYDAKRDRMLFVTLGGYALPFDGQIYALDMATSQMAPLNPEGMGDPRLKKMWVREVAHDPGNDLFLWAAPLSKAKAPATSPYPAYDPVKNRWVLADLVLGENAPIPGVSGGMLFDAKRNLFWVCDSSVPGYGGGVCVLRLDPAKAGLKSLKDSAPPPAPAPVEKK